MTKKRGGGRPPKYNKAQIAAFVAAFRAYIDSTDIPIVAEFAYKNHIDRTMLYNRAEFGTLLGECLAKKEASLERKTLNKEVSERMAMFSLQQLGWRNNNDQRLDATIKVEMAGELQDYAK